MVYYLPCVWIYSVQGLLLERIVEAFSKVLGQYFDLPERQIYIDVIMREIRNIEFC